MPHKRSATGKVLGALWYLEPAAGVCMVRLIEVLIELETSLQPLVSYVASEGLNCEFERGQNM